MRDRAFGLPVPDIVLRLRHRRLRLQSARPDVHRLIERVGLHRLPGVLFEGPAPAVA